MATNFWPTATPQSPVKRGLPALRVWHLAWLAILYAVGLWWVHSLIRSPFNLDYFRRYVSLRCSAAQTAGIGAAPSRDELIALEETLRACQRTEVAIDGVWGGIYGKPSVRLRVVSDPQAGAELKYYSVDVDPVLGIASIAYEITPAFYYVNF